MAPRNTDHEIDDKQVRFRRPHNPDLTQIDPIDQRSSPMIHRFFR